MLKVWRESDSLRHIMISFTQYDHDTTIRSLLSPSKYVLWWATLSFLSLNSNSGYVYICMYVLRSSLHDSHDQCHHNRDYLKLEVGHSCVTVLYRYSSVFS